MITKLTVKNFPSSYLEAELESRSSFSARGFLRTLSDMEIIQELEYRKSRSIINNRIFKWLRIKL